MSDEKELKDQRIPIMMAESELKAIDDWSFKNRIRSRGDAIRRLCQVGLQLDSKMKDIERSRMIAFYALDRMRSFLNVPEEHEAIDQNTISKEKIDLYAVKAQGGMVSGSLKELGLKEDPLPETVEEAFYEVLSSFREFELEIFELIDASYHSQKEGVIAEILAEMKENPIKHDHLRKSRKEMVEGDDLDAEIHLEETLPMANIRQATKKKD